MAAELFVLMATLGVEPNAYAQPPRITSATPAAQPVDPYHAYRGNGGHASYRDEPYLGSRYAPMTPAAPPATAANYAVDPRTHSGYASPPEAVAAPAAYATQPHAYRGYPSTPEGVAPPAWGAMPLDPGNPWLDPAACCPPYVPVLPNKPLGGFSKNWSEMDDQWEDPDAWFGDKHLFPPRMRTMPRAMRRCIEKHVLKRPVPTYSYDSPYPVYH